MRLTALTIKNFKGIDERGVRIDFAPITLLFGPNNAGKSTVIQALHLAREVLCNNNPDPDHVEGGGESMNLGGFKKFVHKHDLNRTVGIGLEIDLEGKDLPSFVRHDAMKWQEMQELFDEYGHAKHTTEKCPYWHKLEALSQNGLLGTSWEPAQEALNRVSSIGVEIGISWGLATKRAFVSGYAVTMGGIEMGGISCKENGAQLFEGIEFSHFLSPQEKDQCRQYIKIHLQSDKNDDGAIEEDVVLPEIVELLSRIIDSDATWETLAPGSTCSDYCQAEPEIINPELKGSALPLWDSPLDVSEITASKVCESFLSSLLVGPGLLLRELLQKQLLYIGPLRAIPSRNFLPAKTVAHDRWANGMASWDMLAVAEAYELELVNQWLTGETSLQTGYTVLQKNVLELNADGPLAIGLRVAAVEDDLDETVLPLLRKFLAQASEPRLVFRNQISGVEVLPHDMGVGISQVMPVLVAGALSKRGALIAIEQPELHIHPAWQTTLGDIFLQAVAKENPPLFLLETHSEHLMLRILRRIRETHEEELPAGFPEAQPELVSVLYVQPQEGGHTEIIRIPVTPDGDFGRKWPNGFFAERAKELF
jgi:hypothetical protein